jgi:hypothetical protein
MPRYFFHQYIRGHMTEDPSGMLLPTWRSMSPRLTADPARLKRAEEDSSNTHVATEVTDGNRTLFVVRGKIVVERR